MNATAEVLEDYQCSACGATPAPSEIIESRGALWHRPCARVFTSLPDCSVEYVGLPSAGRIGPVTIITKDSE